MEFGKPNRFTAMSGARKISNVLLVEDCPDDVLFMTKALAKIGYPAERVVAVENGAEAIAFLERKADYADVARFPTPDIILTDLKMPIVNGLELVRWIKQNPDFKTIPTMVLTSSAHRPDVKQAFADGANAYLQKPSSFQELEKVLSQSFDFWNQNELPEN